MPHAPTLLLFTASAQTHLFPEIRIDAVRFLDLLLQYIPNAVVDGWGSNSDGHGRRVLEGYLGILNAGTIFGEDGGLSIDCLFSRIALTSCSFQILNLCKLLPQPASYSHQQ